MEFLPDSCLFRTVLSPDWPILAVCRNGPHVPPGHVRLAHSKPRCEAFLQRRRCSPSVRAHPEPMQPPFTFPALGTTATLLVTDDRARHARAILANEIDAIDLACSVSRGLRTHARERGPGAEPPCRRSSWRRCKWR